VPAALRELAEEVHVLVEELDAAIAARALGVPADRDLVVGGDVHAVEAAMRGGVEGGALLAGAQGVDEDVTVVPHEHQVVAVEADVRLAAAADRGVLGEGLHDRDRVRRDVVGLQLVPALVVDEIVVRARPARLRGGVHVEGRVLQVAPVPVVDREVAVVLEEEARVVVIEEPGARILGQDPGEVSAIRVVGRVGRVRQALDAAPEGGVGVARPLGGRRKAPVVVRLQDAAAGSDGGGDDRGGAQGEPTNDQCKTAHRTTPLPCGGRTPMTRRDPRTDGTIQYGRFGTGARGSTWRLRESSSLRTTSGESTY
jgi:hypothetical protein